MDYTYFTYEDLKNDALAAIRFLRGRSDIDQGNIGLMGISESGWFTPQLAAEDGHIRFIINRVSSPFSVTETVIHERKMDAMAEGFTEEEVETTILPLTVRIWQFYIDAARNTGMAQGPERESINRELSRLNKHDRFGKWFTFDKLREYDARLYTARSRNYSYDPLPFIEQIDTPMLYVLAGKDKNMPTEKIVNFLTSYAEENHRDITLQIYSDASHYLYRWGLEDGPYDGILYIPGYLDLLTDWAASKVE